MHRCAEVESRARRHYIQLVATAFVFGPAPFVLAFVWLIVAVGIILPIWAIVDVASHPTEAFRAAGSSKATWIVAIVAFTILFDVIGLALSIFYLAVTRAKVRRFDLR